MFRSLLYKSGVSLKRVIINGDSSSSSSSATSAKCFLFTAFQNQNVMISNSRVTKSIFYSTGNRACSDSSNSFVVSYLINSCGLSETQAIIASEKLNFKTTEKPDSVLTLLRSYGFTESHISKVIYKYPSILLSKPDKTLKPKLDFFNSKGLYGIDLADYISVHPMILKQSFNKDIIPSFDILKSIVQSDQNVIKIITRNSWILGTFHVERLMVNLELLRNVGVPETNVSKHLINQPRAFARDTNSFKEIVEKVKDMGFNHLQTTFLVAVHALTSMSEDSWRKKMDVYKRWGWSEDQIQTAFRKHPYCMTSSEDKIIAVMNFTVNEMGYESSDVAETPILIRCSLKERIIPRCSVSRILVCKGLIKEMISLSQISTMVDKLFLEKFVKMYEQEVPELMEVFQGQLNYQDLLLN